jgi:hypothetical protein
VFIYVNSGDRIIVPTKSEYVQCKGCGGLSTRSPDQMGHPWGWLSLSINIPKKAGKGYDWIGVYCSLACLEDSLDAIETSAGKYPDYDSPQFLNPPEKILEKTSEGG